MTKTQEMLAKASRTVCSKCGRLAPFQKKNYLCAACEKPRLCFTKLQCDNYKPVYLKSMHRTGRPNDPDNIFVVETAIREYLQNLKDLQDSIIEKYQSLIKPELPQDCRDRKEIVNGVWEGHDRKLLSKLCATGE